MPARMLLASLLLFLAAASAWVLWLARTPAASSVGPEPSGAAAAPIAPPVAPARAVASELPADEWGASVERLEVAAAGAWTVQGRAVSAPDTPVPGAKVLARAFRGARAVGEPAVRVHLVADSAGRFTWPLEPPAGIACLELRGEEEGMRSHPVTFVVAPGDPPPPAFDLWIVPLAAVARGRVLDEQDRPIAGARVGTSAQDGVHTDEAGRFELAVQLREHVMLHASARGFVPLRQDVEIDLAQGAGEAELRLRAGHRIHGRVTDLDQRPIAGAFVRTFYTAEGVETDADGRYDLDILDPSLESHILFARKPGWVESRVDVAASASGVEQDLVMRRGVTVRGTVLDLTGRPVTAATVFLGFSPFAYNRLDAVSDVDGSFVFDCVPPGEETLNVERRGFASKRQKITVPAAPAPDVEVHVHLEAGHFIGGIARGADGTPIEGTWVAPRLDGDYIADIRGQTDAGGRFRLDGLPPNGLSLEFHGTGLLRKTVPVPTVDRDDLDVVLERAGSLAGTVVDGRSGEPIRDFRIRFGRPRLLEGERQGSGYSAQWIRGGEAFRDERGEFRIPEELVPGSIFALEASAEGFGPLVHDRVVVQLDPDPAALVFALFPGASIEGVVRERVTQLPVAGARLKAYTPGRPLRPSEPNDDMGRPIAVSDASGAFRLEGVGPGEVFLAAAHPDWLRATHGPIPVVAGEAVSAQEVLLDGGVLVTVAVRGPDGAPMAGAEVCILARDAGELTGRSDAAGTARIERVPSGEHELVLVETSGARSVHTFRRALRVGPEDCSVELVASDGDATLVVVLDAPGPLPDGLQLLCTPAAPAEQDPELAFLSRGVFAQPGRTVIASLPAMELRVSLTSGKWAGTSTVTTRAGETVEVRLAVQ